MVLADEPENAACVRDTQMRFIEDNASIRADQAHEESGIPLRGKRAVRENARVRGKNDAARTEGALKHDRSSVNCCNRCPGAGVAEECTADARAPTFYQAIARRLRIQCHDDAITGLCGMLESV